MTQNFVVDYTNERTYEQKEEKKHYITVNIKSSKSSIFFQEVASKTMSLLHIIYHNGDYHHQTIPFKTKVSDTPFDYVSSLFI